MARSRFNPWAAYVDLFGGLLIVSLAALAITRGGAEKTEARVRDLERAVQRRTLEEQRAAELFERLEKALSGRSRSVRIDSGCSSPIERCIDVDFKFDRDRDELSVGDMDLLRIVAGELSAVLQADAPYVDIVVEGHTDASLPRNVSDDRTVYKYNWDLSARRASAVMYELKGQGFRVFRMKAQGRANTDQRCKRLGDRDYLDDDCGRQNRRTTIKVAYRFNRSEVSVAPR